MITQAEANRARRLIREIHERFLAIGEPERRWPTAELRIGSRMGEETVRMRVQKAQSIVRDAERRREPMTPERARSLAEAWGEIREGLAGQHEVAEARHLAEAKGRRF